MTDRASTILDGRVKTMEEKLGRPLVPAEPKDDYPLPEHERGFLLEAAQDLYWNEMAWEYLTDEERVSDGRLTALVFPGFLALVRGLLLRETLPDALAPAIPRPEVVQDVLRFLSERLVELEEKLAAADEERRERCTCELGMTDRLIDLVLYRLLGLTPEDVARLEISHESE